MQVLKIDMDFKKKIRTTKNLKERIKLCAILANANGHPVKTIAAILQISESTVYEYLHEFESSKTIKVNSFQGRKSKLSEDQERNLAEYISSNPHFSLKEIRDHIQEKFTIDYTLSGIRDWLNRKNLRNKLKKHIL